MAAISRTPIYAALIGNLLIAVTKFIAATLTGSSAMLSEGVHSLVDTGNELLLLYGLRRAAQPADLERPLGYGRELYFWSFIVALLIFALGAGVSFYEGITHIFDPAPVRDATVSYVVLGLSAVFEGATWLVALREFRPHIGSRGLFAAVRQSKDPTTFTVLFEDSAALLGLAIAFFGILASQIFALPELDGAASIGIGLVLAITAVFLARETKGLLMGEPASVPLERSIVEIASADPAVQRANGVLTVHMAPDQIVVALSLEFKDEMTTPEIERCVERLERQLKEEHAHITVLFIKPQTHHTWRGQQDSLQGSEAQ
ncbi:MAG: cation diffusion facilitator family transporter [Rhodospirillales bacterium]